MPNIFDENELKESSTVQSHLQQKFFLNFSRIILNMIWCVKNLVANPKRLRYNIPFI